MPSNAHPKLQTPEATPTERLAGLGIPDCVLANSPRNSRDSKRHVLFPRLQLASADGAITIRDGKVVITKGSAAALTLAAPTTAQDYTEIEIVSATAYAHTVTTPSAIMHWGDSGGADDVGTFAAYRGACMRLMAYNGAWQVLNLQGVTLA